MDGGSEARLECTTREPVKRHKFHIDKMIAGFARCILRISSRDASLEAKWWTRSSTCIRAEGGHYCRRPGIMALVKLRAGNCEKLATINTPR